MKIRTCKHKKDCSRSCVKTKTGYIWLLPADMHEGSGWIPCLDYWSYTYTDKEKGLEKFGAKNERK